MSEVVKQETIEEGRWPDTVVPLVGEDGNAFAILGRCNKAARRAGATKEDIEAFMAEATSGDYNHLLQTVMRNFDADGGPRCDECGASVHDDECYDEEDSQ